LSGWDQFWIVVAGSIFVALVLTGASRLWRWARRPKIIVEGGNDEDFHYTLSTRNPRQAAILGHRIADIYTTRLRVTETRGVQARNVQVRVRFGGGQHPKTLQWINEADGYTLEGGIPAYVRICEFFQYADGTTGSRSHHPHVRPGKRVEVEVEVAVNGGKANRKTFCFVVDWKEDSHFAEVSAK